MLSSTSSSSRLLLLRGATVSTRGVVRAFSGHGHHTPPTEHATTPEKFGGMDKDIFLYLVQNAAPFIHKVFKPTVERMTNQELELLLPYNKSLTGNVAVPCLHGGVVATMIDHTGGFCCWANLEDPHYRVNTIDLRVDYLAPAPCDDIRFVAQVVHRTKKLIRADVVVWDKHYKKKLAIGRTLFNIYREEVNLQELLTVYLADLKANKIQEG